MKMHILFSAALGSFVLVALPCTALAKKDEPMVGLAVERAEVLSGNAASSAVVPVVVGADTVASAPTSDLPAAPTVAPPSSPVTSKAATPGTTPGQTPIAQIERLSIQAGQRLSVALGAWLKSQSVELSWEPAGTLLGRVRDVVIDSAWLASQTALEPTLSEVLAPFGLTAHILRQRQSTDASNVTILDASPTSVVVRNASNARP
ncbi:hypothetical protein [Limnohabitans lacus]|jgi:hypothetical protein|uniref:Toxin co-regulated pilus biosynthesis protein Q C-terminal domain-containing protein n=1 Tax=Limnohabitans lacus TaxID=3045173 RepID=A0ABT6XAL6_9BURK|nr:hypothetical protein [Limnohabitans sp. HM2-2]MDI9235184.1 hypothetical protein [Limnohabitans sp. HM2-2]